MKKRKLILSLALLLLLSSFIACGNTSEQTDENPSTGTVETITPAEEPKEWRAFDNLPEQNYNGRTFTILSRIGNENQFFAEEYTGDSVNDTIYDRNAAVAERYNIEFAVSSIDGSWANSGQWINTILSSVQANDGAYDLVDGYAAVVGSLVMEGCFLNLNEVAYIEPTEKWWSKSAVEDLAFNNKVYITPGDISMSIYDNIFAMFFNQDRATEFALSDFYTLVDEGKWTYDKFLRIADTCLIDVDGNGEYNDQDIYGIVFSDDLEYNNFHYAFEIPITIKGDDGYPVFNLGDESVADLVTTMQTLAYNTSGVYYPKNAEVKNRMFKEGRAILVPNRLSAIGNFRDMESDFGILPYPKYEEGQEGYYTTCHDEAIMFAIPIDVKDISFAGLISEALCQISYQTLKPIYYEAVLKVKLARDEESQKMIDILRDGLVFDMGAVYAVQLNRAGFLTRDCVYYQHEYASYYKSNQKAFETSLNTFLAKFKEE